MTVALLLLGLGWLCLPPRASAAAGPAGSLPLALDLVAAALGAGQGIADAIAAGAGAAPVRDRAGLLTVVAQLRDGADPRTAWASLADGPLADLATAARRSSVSGSRLAAAFEAAAARLRADASAAAVARAARAGVLLTLPLALCFLPAFVCLGVVPSVVGLTAAGLS